MITLKETEDLSLPRSARSYIDRYAAEYKWTDENTKIAELAYRLKRGADLLPAFIEDISQHLAVYGDYEDIAKLSIAGYIEILRTGRKYGITSSYLPDTMKFPALFRLLTEEIFFRYWETPFFDRNIGSYMVECHFDNVHYDYNEIAARFKDVPNAKRKILKYISTPEETINKIDMENWSKRGMPLI